MQLPENKRRTVDKITKHVIWLYGAPFSGKSYLANKFPDPLFLNTDGNVKFIDSPYISIKDIVTPNGRLVDVKRGWVVFKEVIAELEKKQNTFKTIVIDLLDDIREFCRLYVFDKLKITHESENPFKAWDMVSMEFLSSIRKVVNLDYENIILISHEDTTKDLTMKTGDKITSIQPNLPEKLTLKISGMVDCVGRVVDDGRKRTISFHSNDVVFGGGRLGFGDKEIPCEYTDLINIYEQVNKGK